MAELECSAYLRDLRVKHIASASWRCRRRVNTPLKGLIQPVKLEPVYCDAGARESGCRR